MLTEKIGNDNFKLTGVRKKKIQTLTVLNKRLKLSGTSTRSFTTVQSVFFLLLFSNDFVLPFYRVSNLYRRAVSGESETLTSNTPPPTPRTSYDLVVARIETCYSRVGAALVPERHVDAGPDHRLPCLPTAAAAATTTTTET